MSGSGGDVWVYVEHLQGVVAGQTYELLGKGRELASSLGSRLVAVLLGDAEQVGPAAQGLGAADAVLCVEDATLAGFTPDGYAAVLRALVTQSSPRLALFGATSMGMDLAGLLAPAFDSPLAVNCNQIRIQDGAALVTTQLCGGKLLSEVEITGSPAFLTVLPGAFPREPGIAEGSATVERVPLPPLPSAARTRFVRLIEPAAGDVDMTRIPVLVGVGRGIQRQENIAVAEELAAALGGTLCASRPVVDQGWMPLARQVGKSGMTVSPRLYVALGISGAPEHVEGMKNSELIVAINSDERAPIFGTAHVGVVADMFDVLPPLLEQVKQKKGAGSA